MKITFNTANRMYAPTATEPVQLSGTVDISVEECIALINNCPDFFKYVVSQFSNQSNQTFPTPRFNTLYNHVTPPEANPFTRFSKSQVDQNPPVSGHVVGAPNFSLSERFTFLQTNPGYGGFRILPPVYRMFAPLAVISDEVQSELNKLNIPFEFCKFKSRGIEKDFVLVVGSIGDYYLFRLEGGYAAVKSSNFTNVSDGFNVSEVIHNVLANPSTKIIGNEETLVSLRMESEQVEPGTSTPFPMPSDYGHFPYIRSYPGVAAHIANGEEIIQCELVNAGVMLGHFQLKGKDVFDNKRLTIGKVEDYVLIRASGTYLAIKSFKLMNILTIEDLSTAITNSYSEAVLIKGHKQLVEFKKSVEDKEKVNDNTTDETSFVFLPSEEYKYKPIAKKSPIVQAELANVDVPVFECSFNSESPSVTSFNVDLFMGEIGDCYLVRFENMYVAVNRSEIPQGCSAETFYKVVMDINKASFINTPKMLANFVKRHKNVTTFKALDVDLADDCVYRVVTKSTATDLYAELSAAGILGEEFILNRGSRNVDTVVGRLGEKILLRLSDRWIAVDNVKLDTKALYAPSQCLNDPDVMVLRTPDELEGFVKRMLTQPS